MDIPRFWTRVRLDREGREDPKGPAIALGWSDESAEAAWAAGWLRASRVAEALRSGRFDTLRESWEYYPLNRPLCEELVEELEEDGRVVGAITRNAYGAFVLNTTEVMFLDVDRPAAPPASWWRSWWGPKPPPPADLVARLTEEVGRHPGLGLRLYETAAGYRGLVTSATFEPTSEAADALLRAFGSDPLYVQLTRTQQCFRARLSPKPWRLGLPSPMTHWFPLDDAARVERFAAWDVQYGALRPRFSVCGAPLVIGEAAWAPGVAAIVALHDAWCVTGRPLA